MRQDNIVVSTQGADAPGSSSYRISLTQSLRIAEAARDTAPVTGYTHNHYRYPARFSPRFVRTAIELFTDPGDLVVDPFVGGGTTLVEALALGRSGVGSDISALAAFVTEVKTTLLSDKELEDLSRWSRRLPRTINLHRRSIQFEDWAAQGYYRHLEQPATWRLRKAVEQALASATRLGSARLENFARCVILRTAQWALDARKRVPGIAEFRETLVKFAEQMIVGALDLRQAAYAAKKERACRVWCLNRSAAGLAEERIFHELPAPRLVLTSPPYPGIHMLYHRWQVDGRKETPAPFWIANKLDGAGSSFYTMGDRKYPELRTYFENLRAALTSVAQISNEKTTIIQVVAFSDPCWQLPRYLEIAAEAGLQEIELAIPSDRHDGRLWRQVPNRRWHAGQKGDTPSSQEVVLIHRLSTSMQPLPRSAISVRAPRLVR